MKHSLNFSLIRLHRNCNLVLLHYLYPSHAKNVMFVASWFLNKGSPGGGKEKTWKSKSKKELPMGQALMGLRLFFLSYKDYLISLAP